MPRKRRIVIDVTEYSDSELSSDDNPETTAPPSKRRKITRDTTSLESNTTSQRAATTPIDSTPLTTTPPIHSTPITPAASSVPAESQVNMTQQDTTPRSAPTFPGTDFDQLASNKEHYWRFLQNSNKAAAAVFALDEEGNTIATQYPAPLGLLGEETPNIRPLENIQRSMKFGQEVFLANTPNGTAMSARRFYAGEQGKENPKPFEIGIFSPTNPKTFWGGGSHTVDLLSNKLDEKMREELAEEFEELETVFKGEDYLIDNPSVPVRDGHKKRPMSQNEVMARHYDVKNDKNKWDYSARTHLKDFLSEYGDFLSKEIVEQLEKSIKATYTGFKSQPGEEWLHALGYSLTSMKDDPQVANNLAAGPKWANTMMMVLERIAKWFAMYRPESRIHIKPLFEMLLNYDIIHKLYFEVDVDYNNEYLRMFMDIHPFKKWPLYPKAYDMAFTTYYVHEKLSNAAPLSTQIVQGATRVNRPPAEARPSYAELAEEWAIHKTQLKHAIGEQEALKEYEQLDTMEIDKVLKEKPKQHLHALPLAMHGQTPDKVDAPPALPKKSIPSQVVTDDKVETDKILQELDALLFSTYKRRRVVEESDDEFDAMLEPDEEELEENDEMDIEVESAPAPRRSKRLRKMNDS